MTKIPITQVMLFPIQDRPGFLAANGAQAPAYDVSRPIKRWRDASGSGSATVTFTVYDPALKTIHSLTMTRDEAAAINLPGVFAYAKFSVPDTPARVIDLAGRETQFNVAVLSQQDAANAVALEIGGTLYEAPLAYWPYSIDWRGETRRQWMILWKGKTLRAADLIFAKFANGIGAPGKWNVDGEAPAWMSDKAPEGAWTAMPEVPFPIRPLADNETLELGIAGSMDAFIVQADAPVAGGSFTDADRATLKAIAQKVGA